METTVLNKALNKVEVYETFDSFIWTDRYSTHGDFELVIKASGRELATFQEEYYLQIADSEHTMIIESVELKTDIEEGDTFTIKGRSLETILERRIIWKQTILSGGLQAGIKRLLDENAISPIDPDRKITKLEFEFSTNPLIAALSIDQQFTGDNLLEVIEQLCDTNGIGYKITISPDKKFIFTLYAGEDRSFDQLANPFVAFSPDLENLSNTNYFHSKAPLKTITLVAGEGEGADRLTAQVAMPNLPNTDLDRREKFTDARDISTTIEGDVLSPEEYYTLLIERGFLSLLESGEISSFDGKVEPTINYIYGEDFYLGDIVQIENEYGLKGKARVTELVISEDLSGSDIYPTFQMI